MVLYDGKPLGRATIDIGGLGSVLGDAYGLSYLRLPPPPPLRIHWHPRLPRIHRISLLGPRLLSLRICNEWFVSKYSWKILMMSQRLGAFQGAKGVDSCPKRPV